MDSTVEEEWREVPGYEGRYEVSSMGRVRSWHSLARRGYDFPKPLAIQTDKAGYKRTAFAGKHHYLHRLVALAWLGPIPEGHEVHHSNKNRGDNRPENLEIVTKQFNLANRRKREKLNCPHCGYELW